MKSSSDRFFGSAKGVTGSLGFDLKIFEIQSNIGTLLASDLLYVTGQTPWYSIGDLIGGHFIAPYPGKN